MPTKKTPVLFPHYRSLLATILILFCGQIMSFQAQAEISKEYTAPDWKDLIPETWQPPLIEPDSTEYHVDKKSLATKLQRQQIKLPGYMVPVKFTSNMVSEFILMPFLKHQVRTHYHHEPNQLVYVVLAEPLEVNNPYLPVWASGQIRLESVDTDAGHTGYTLRQAIAETYIY